MIDWSKLKPYGSDKYHSFEELCYQIAKGLHGHEGRLTSIDDSGGGDGVEFYLTFPDGRQWGWQAKFYFPNGRLTSSRKTSIQKSLQKACEKHPRLEKWFLCLPTNLTPDEQEWFDRKLPGSSVKGRPTMPHGHGAELELWGESDFIAWIGQERFGSMRHYFFGELELSSEWGRHQYQKQVEGVGDRFEPTLHTETHVDATIHALLGDIAFEKRLNKLLDGLSESLGEYKERVSKLMSASPLLRSTHRICRLSEYNLTSRFSESQ